MNEELVAAGPQKDAFVLKYSKDGTEVRASEDVFHGFADGFERLWYFTLNWISAHPFLFVCILLMLAFGGWLRHLTKVQIAALKTDYKASRDRARLGAAPKSRRVK